MDKISRRKNMFYLKKNTVLLCQVSVPDHHVCIFSLRQVLPPPDAGQRQLRLLPSEQVAADGKQERGGGWPGARHPAGVLHPLHPRAAPPLPAADARDVMDGLHPLPIQEEVMCSTAAALQHSEDRSPEELKSHLGGNVGPVWTKSAESFFRSDTAGRKELPFPVKASAPACDLISINIPLLIAPSNQISLKSGFNCVRGGRTELLKWCRDCSLCPCLVHVIVFLYYWSLPT